MLERAYHFLSEKGRADVETAAERFFGALGYRPKPSAPAIGDDTTGAGGDRPLRLVRGHRFASFYSPSLRACAATVQIVANEVKGKPTTVHVAHRVETRGRLVTAEDADLLEAEARAFERFLEKADPETAEILLATYRRAHRAVALKLAALAAFAVAVFAIALAVALGVGR